LHDQVTDEEDRNSYAVLKTCETKVVFQGIETSLGKGVAVQVVQEVHGPQDQLGVVSVSLIRSRAGVLIMMR
jgi:hypothetical protein